MTKDWDAVQDEIRELSFHKKRPLEEVKELMERKYKFRASTRAYRMKLKEWGLMRHKPRKTAANINDNHNDPMNIEPEDYERARSNSSVTAENMSIGPASVEPAPQIACEKEGGWEVVPAAELAVAEPTFMGMLHQAPTLEPFFDPLSAARNRATEIVMNMLGAMLENDVSKLEQLVVDNANHVNDPLGMPFETPSSRFFGHPALNQMMILQHPGQTLLDIACGMPCGPIIWILLSHGAKGSRHPLGTDLALHNAIKNGRPYTVQAMLLPSRSDVNGTSASTWRPLLQAVFWNHPEVVRILIRKGAHIDAVGPSPSGIGTNTALQLCLERRAVNYATESLRARHNQTLKMLLDAGANTHVGPTLYARQTPLDLFLKPHYDDPYWGTRISVLERDCLRMFVSRGAELETYFKGCPCGPRALLSFRHQVLWHSTPSMARLVIDSFIPIPQDNGSTLLHEILGNCPDAKRHPADTLRDIQVLLQRGVDVNLPDDKSVTPLMKCLEHCPAVDLVPRLKILLEAGADPEAVDRNGVPLYAFAARTFEEPLRSDIMQLLVTHIGGRYTNTIDGVDHSWSSAHFPIAEDQTYEQVIASTRSTGSFKIKMKDMIPIDVQPTFSRAYFAAVSKNFLDTITRAAKSRMLIARDKDEVGWILGMRAGIDLPAYTFDQELVIALLHPTPVLDMDVSANIVDAGADKLDGLVEDNADISSPTPRPTSPPSAPTPLARAQWTFDTNPSTTSPPPLPRPSSGSRTPTSSASDPFFPSTTQIRWRDPTAKTKPGDLEKASAAVLVHKCDVCDDGTLLTKREEERHEVEHQHTSACDGVGCERRFCIQRKKRRDEEHGGDNGDGNVVAMRDVGCQDHLFGGDFDLAAPPGQAELARVLTDCLGNSSTSLSISS